ncbi:MAG: CapA family protein [Actinobacteria bacterium]|nr:MAG: CapA family protein [Actinomycetota bacterium]RIK07582.1 MAG: poly-gamma-glutamate biosynthesis protein [Acidobacteriota bacterium]
MSRTSQILLAGVLVVGVLLAVAALLPRGEDAGTEGGSGSIDFGTDDEPLVFDDSESAEEQTTTTSAPLRSFTIAATGDFLIHSPVYAKALEYGGGDSYDFDPMLEAISPIISQADLGICHLETPLSADNGTLQGYPLFNTPYELAQDIADAGYDTCSTVSNHALDMGFDGIVATLGHLDSAGLAHAGSARSPEEASTPNIMDVNGVKVAQLAYSYGFNGIPIPAEQPWSVNEIDQQRILDDARKAKEAGAEFVVVSLQWGNEYQHEPSEQQATLAPVLLASPDIDLIIGHHVHVVQPIEKIGGEYVAYGVGNFLSNQSAETGITPESQDGVIVQVQVAEESPGVFKTTGLTYTPTWVERPGYRVVPVDPATNAVSYERTVGYITMLGPERFDGTPTS